MPRHDGSTLSTSTEDEERYCTVDAKTRGEVVAVGGRDRVVRSKRQIYSFMMTSS